MIGGRCGLLAWSFVVVCGGEFQADGSLEEETQQESNFGPSVNVQERRRTKIKTAYLFFCFVFIGVRKTGLERLPSAAKALPSAKED